MKLTFFGTAPGVPQPDRYCTSMMLETGGSVYLIDAGAPVTDLLLRRGMLPTDVRAVFATHIHSDHTDGIYRLADLVNGFYKTHEMDIYIPDREFIDLTVRMLELCAGHPNTKFDGERVRFHEIDPSAAYDDGNLRLSYFPTGHIDKPYHSYAFLAEAEGKKILFGGDLSKHLRDADIPAPAFDGNVDLFVCEYAHIRGEDIAPYLPRITAKTVCFNHIPTAEKFAEVEAMNGKYAFRACAPRDGDVFEI